MSVSGLPPHERLWRGVLEHVAERVHADDFTRLIRPLRPLSVSPTQLRLEAPTRLVLVAVTESFLPMLHEEVAALAGPRQVVLELTTRSQGELFPDIAPRRPGRRAAGAYGTLDPRYTFGRFVVGASNQFAHAAAKAVASQPGDHYNPLFIYGGVGLGKTHLVNAIGHEVLDRTPLARIAYLSSDAFMNDLIASLQRDKMEEFKQRFRHVDVLILDDVQLLAGRERTQEEFFHTFNTLHEQRHQIVLTSDKVPRDIQDLEARLRNRFEWGLIADIQPPDIETRVAIVEKKAEAENIPISPDVALFLAEQIASNVRELEGSLLRLGAHASLSRRPITPDYAREVLHIVLRPKPRALTFDDIATAVCHHFSVRTSDLRSRRRSRHVALPRQVAMYLCRRHMNASFPQIGSLFSRDHSTVIHAVTTIEHRLKEDVGLQAALMVLERTIRGESA